MKLSTTANFHLNATAQHLRRSLRVTHAAEPIAVSVLLSIHVVSNRPQQFTEFLDSLENSADEMSSFEVCVKIDDHDQAMNRLLKAEVQKRPFALKYISTPLPGGFFGSIWKALNDLLEITDPNAYFLMNVSDEVAFREKGWDTRLKGYVGLFPDHLYRLRISEFRFRNYHDVWECGFAPEVMALTTKKWIDVQGSWNPCLGPDNFQQCVAFYFGYFDRFDRDREIRDIPIHDFEVMGEGAQNGVSGERILGWYQGSCRAWFRLFSWRIQQQAAQRAQLLKATIQAQRYGYQMKHCSWRGAYSLYDRQTGEIVRRLNYRLNFFKIVSTNLVRSFRYAYFSGGGERVAQFSKRRFVSFLELRYAFIYRSLQTLNLLKGNLRNSLRRGS